MPLNSTKVVFIPKGSTSSIIAYLNKSGYELNFIDKLFIRFLGYPQQGWIDLKTNKMTKADFLYKLTTSKAALRSITLIPGETSYFFLKEIAEKMNLSEEKLIKSYEKFAFKEDGNILAESYKLPLGMSEENLIFFLIQHTEQQYKKFSEKIFGQYNKQNWYYYVSIASVIQKEAANVEEMPMVSSVIYNRLNKGMPLQMDGTLNYGKYSRTKITAKRIREDKSSYNTYANKGIPKNPVSSVSLDAIKAAIFPAKTPYLYFVKNNITKLHDFSTTYEEHVRKIKNNPMSSNNASAKQKEKVPNKTIKNIEIQKNPAIIKDLWKNIN